MPDMGSNTVFGIGRVLFDMHSYKRIINFITINIYFLPSSLYRLKHLKESRHYQFFLELVLHLYFKIKSI
jgi:hypothetical protein